MTMIRYRKNPSQHGLDLSKFITWCFFVCLFWKVGCVSTGVVTIFVFFPSVLSVIRAMLILFLRLTRGSLKRINQYPLLIPPHSSQLPKTMSMLFFSFILSSRNWPRTMTHPPVKCSLCCCFVVPLRQSSFFSPLYPELTAFQRKRSWKQNFASSLLHAVLQLPCCSLLILPSCVPIQHVFTLQCPLLQHFASVWSHSSFLFRC